MRIVSLLPSTTEILFAVGAGVDVVGVTFECDHPPEARRRRIVSSTSLPVGLTPAQIDAEVRARMAAGDDLYHLDEGALRDLDPEVVVTQDLCAVCAIDVTDVDAALDHLGCQAQVVNVDPATLDDVLASILTVGAAAGRLPVAEQLVTSLQDRLDAVATAVAGRRAPRVAVVEWPDPPFSAGHWVPDMVTAAGGAPVLAEAGGRSAAVTWEQVAAAAPEVVVLAPCGYGLDEASSMASDIAEAGHLPAGVALWAAHADGYVVRPGPRLVDGVEGLAGLLHPGVLPPRHDIFRAVRSAAPAR